MKLTYRDGTTEDDPLFDMLPASQRMYVADCMNLGPNWVKEPGWERLIDMLLSIRRYEGKQSFFREIGRLVCPDFN